MTASYYSDGRSGQKRAVNLVFGADGIRFLDDNELLISFWSYEGLNLIGAVSRATPFQLRHERFKEASLTCDDPTVLQKLKNICPQIKSTLTYPVVRSIRRLIALALAATVFIYMSMFSIKIFWRAIAELLQSRNFLAKNTPPVLQG